MTTIAAKTTGLLVAGKVTIQLVADGVVIADVIGDTGVHRVALDRGGWSCDCPASTYRKRCSHVTACALLFDHPTRPDAVRTVTQ